MRRSAWVAAGALAVLAATGGVAWWLVVDGGRADPNDAAQVARGRIVYAEQCASCHGENLEGQPDWRRRFPDGRLPAPPHDSEGHTWHHPDKQLFKITRDGIAAVAPPGYVSDMPAYAGTLSDAEIWDVLAYIKSKWPDEIRRRQERVSAAQQ